MSTIELKWTDRIIGSAQTPRRFLDFVVDGEPLYEKMGEVISPLGWLSIEGTKKAVDRLLRKVLADFPNGRNSIYVCPECADLGCGAVSAIIERVDDNIIWRDFGYQNNYDDTVHFEDLEGVGPFTFNATEYYNEITKALESRHEQ
jgi:hypothetical protein